MIDIVVGWALNTFFEKRPVRVHEYYEVERVGSDLFRCGMFDYRGRDCGNPIGIVHKRFAVPPFSGERQNHHEPIDPAYDERCLRQHGVNYALSADFWDELQSFELISTEALDSRLAVCIIQPVALDDSRVLLPLVYDVMPSAKPVEVVHLRKGARRVVCTASGFA